MNIHTDPIGLQLGAVIIQGGIPISFTVVNLTNLRRDKWLQKKIMIKVETLNAFYSIILSQRLNIYTDHKNITC